MDRREGVRRQMPHLARLDIQGPKSPICYTGMISADSADGVSACASPIKRNPSSTSLHVPGVCPSPLIQFNNPTSPFSKSNFPPSPSPAPSPSPSSSIGTVLVVGEAGSGKTSLVRALSSSFASPSAPSARHSSCSSSSSSSSSSASSFVCRTPMNLPFTPARSSGVAPGPVATDLLRSSSSSSPSSSGLLHFSCIPLPDTLSSVSSDSMAVVTDSATTTTRSSRRLGNSSSFSNLDASINPSNPKSLKKIDGPCVSVWTVRERSLLKLAVSPSAMALTIALIVVDLSRPWEALRALGKHAEALREMASSAAAAAIAIGSSSVGVAQTCGGMNRRKRYGSCNFVSHTAAEGNRRSMSADLSALSQGGAFNQSASAEEKGIAPPTPLRLAVGRRAEELAVRRKEMMTWTLQGRETRRTSSLDATKVIGICGGGGDGGAVAGRVVGMGMATEARGRKAEGVWKDAEDGDGLGRLVDARGELKMVVVGTKADLLTATANSNGYGEADLAALQSRLQKACESMGAGLVYTSARSNLNICKLRDQILKSLGREASAPLEASLSGSECFVPIGGWKRQIESELPWSSREGSSERSSSSNGSRLHTDVSIGDSSVSASGSLNGSISASGSVIHKSFSSSLSNSVCSLSEKACRDSTDGALLIKGSPVAGGIEGDVLEDRDRILSGSFSTTSGSSLNHTEEEEEEEGVFRLMDGNVFADVLEAPKKSKADGKAAKGSGKGKANGGIEDLQVFLARNRVRLQCLTEDNKWGNKRDNGVFGVGNFCRGEGVQKATVRSVKEASWIARTRKGGGGGGASESRAWRKECESIKAERANGGAAAPSPSASPAAAAANGLAVQKRNAGNHNRSKSMPMWTYTSDEQSEGACRDGIKISLDRTRGLEKRDTGNCEKDDEDSLGSFMARIMKTKTMKKYYATRGR